jgi:thiamine biosynthesis protein ThiI
MDKEEIIAQAQALGTFEISIVPDQDSCTLFTPRHPETHAVRATVEDAEKSLPIDDMVAAAVKAAAVEQLSFPVVK